MILKGIGLLLLLAPGCFAGTWCFQCTREFHPALCKTVIRCGDHEECFVDKFHDHGSDYFSSGCRAITSCHNTSRRADVKGTHMERAAAPSVCSNCCNHNGCNRNLCGAQDVLKPNETLCWQCPRVRDLNQCDTVTTCTADQMCSTSKQETFGITFYSHDCLHKKPDCEDFISNSSSVKSLLEIQGTVCCRGNLCNDGNGGFGGDAQQAEATIDKKEINYVIGSNETVSVTCSAVGKPAPKVEWQKNGTTLKEGVHATGGKSVLTLPNLKEGESVNYTCFAANQYGNDTKVTVVTVHARPTITVSSNSTIELEVGDNKTIACNASSEDGITEVTWTFEENHEHAVDDKNGSLNLINVQPESGGTYTCVANTKFAKATMDVQVVVLSPPHVHLTAPMTEVLLGNVSSLVLTCSFTGGPVPDITWTFIDTEGVHHNLTEGIDKKPRVSTLTLTNVTSHNSGNYTCVGTNKNGTNSSTLAINIREKPAIVSFSGNTTAKVNDNVELFCNVSGSPPPNITWSSTPPIIISSAVQQNGNVLKLVRVDRNAAGTVRCEARNEYGNASADIHIKIVDPVTIIVKPSRFQPITLVTGRFLFVCTGMGTPEPKITITRLVKPFDEKEPGHQKIMMGSLAQVIISDLSPFNGVQASGIYSCYGDNGETNATEYAVGYYMSAETTCDRSFVLKSPGIVYGSMCRPNCGRSPNPPPPGTKDFSWEDRVCQRAADVGVIDQSGGLVVWVGIGNNTVRILDTKSDIIDVSGLRP